jgi:hypothetical protein
MVRTLFVVAAGVVAAARIASGFDVTACDTTVPPGEIGVLQSDLSCSGAFVGVVLSEGAALEMQGHGISGEPSGNAAVVCNGRRCRVTGPGSISGHVVGIGLTRGRQRLTVSDLDIHDCTTGILDTLSPRRGVVRAANLTLTGCTAAGLDVGKLIGSGIDASGNGGPGLATDRLRAENVVASDNGASGIFGGKARVQGLVANDNGDAGIRVLKAALRDATLTGNNGYGMGFDVLASRHPRAVNVTCGKSGVLGGLATDTWGICADD